MPVAPERVEFCCVRLDESLSALGEVFVLVHIDMDDTAVAQRHTTPRSVRKFRSETDGTIRRCFNHKIGKAIEGRARCFAT